MVTIRTMRDDQREAGRSSGETVSNQSTGTTPAPVFAAPVAPPSAPSSALEPHLPPLATAAPAAKPRRDRVLTTLIALFGLSAVAAVGVWGWIFFQPETVSEVPQEEIAVETLGEAIPASALLMAHYDVAAEQALIQQSWDTQSTQEATMLTALNGDPRFLLSHNVFKFSYILLPGDPRLYLLAESSEELELLLAEHSNFQVLDIGDWRVVHSFSTDVYQQQLLAGSRAAVGMSEGAGTPITLRLSKEFVASMHPWGAELGDAELTLALTVSSDNVQFSSGTDILPTPTIGTNAETLLNRIPADATFIRLGDSFAAQAGRAATPAASQLMTSLTAPYAYYERLGADNSQDIGVVANLPSTLTPALTVPDTAIEESIVALTALSEEAGTSPSPIAVPQFSSGAYKDVPLRFVNITSLLALDYAVVGDFLHLATSKEGMLAAIDRGLEESPTTPWQSLETTTRPFGAERAFGFINQPAIKRLLPGGEAATELPFAVAFDPATMATLRGIISLPTLASEPSPLP